MSLESKILELESNVKQKTPIAPKLIQGILYDHAQVKQRIEDSKIALANAKQLMTENKHLFDAAKEEYKTELITYTKKKEELIPVLEEQAHILENFLKSKFGLDLAEKHSSIEAINNTIKDVEKFQDQKKNIPQRENKHAAARSKLIENENLLMKEFYANPREINKNFLEYAKSMGSKAMNAQKPLDEQQKEVGMLYSVTEKYIKSLQKTVAANRQILQENPDLIHSDPYVMRAKKRAILAEKHLNRALEDISKVAGRLEKKFGFKISDPTNIQGNSKPHEQSQTSVSQSNINPATQDLHTPSSPSTVNPNKLADIKNDKEGKNKLNGIMNSFKKHVVGTRFRSGPKAASTPLPKGKGVNLRNSQDKGKSKM
ncbi:MAG: hypothetical protein K0Q51_721 [Rickettsiaceae bacterium]|jgi:hypothetical protein|nr:hypothetical protein [Rickettsiaceae bacterium]